MQIAHSLQELSFAPSIVTIGNFDGVHRGHRMIIESVLVRSRSLGVRSVAVTFDPHPAHILAPATRLPLITPLAQKLDMLASTGLDLALVLPFNLEMRLWSASQFAEKVLREGLHAIEVHEGETFRLGHGAEANLNDLEQIGRGLNFTVRSYKPRIVRGNAISSSRIRSLVSAGSLPEARALLGRSFSIRSIPAPGRGYGTLYAVPTINLAPYIDLLPANGVYVTALRVGNKHTFRGVTNVGNRPTFGADSFAIETHLLDFEPLTLTEDTPLELTFLHRLRDERRFETPELLRTQIQRDVVKAKRLFALCDTMHFR